MVLYMASLLEPAAPYRFDDQDSCPSALIS
jgi:hypothetical protein